ncbi:MAG TPA: sugar phosphate isomerase/epimerase family protein [Planctomycetia bacterium]|nr:sugar phosphate isomerase/epimerase family protein [Planctomycetia bacterium]
MVKPGDTLQEKMQLIKDLGFDAIELDSPNKFKPEEVLAARDATKLPIIGTVDSVHWKQTLSDPDPAVQAAGVKGLETAIRDAKAYGGTSALLVPAVVTPKVSYQQAWDRSTANIRKALPLAEELGIHIAIENVWNRFLTSPLEMNRYIDQFNSKFVAVHFDIGNYVEWAYPQDWIRTLGKRIVKTDVKEYAKPKRFGYKLGEGEIDWAEVRKALAEIGYAGYCTAEIESGDEAFLKDTAARMDKILGITAAG